jgi:hypothetical protein
VILVFWWLTLSSGRHLLFVVVVVTGYFTFKECPGLTNPTIGIELGESYSFVQEDISNWYHPMGFGYVPDGHHGQHGADASNPLLEPTNTQTGSSCASNFTCPTARYFENGAFLGKAGTGDYGLDVYMPSFFAKLPDWVAAGSHSIELTFNDTNYTSDLFYFCHVRSSKQPVDLAHQMTHRKRTPLTYLL